MCKFNPRRSFLILEKFPPAGIGRLSQSGRRLEPGTDVGSVEVRKSVSAGPEFKFSVKVVLGRPGGMVARLRVMRIKVLECVC